MLLSVIIVSYNVRRYLYQCLQSVLIAVEGVDADVWVVDNQSKDDTMDVLPSIFPTVHFIRNDSNVGFSKANNKAIGLSAGKYVLLLNPDTFVSTASIQESIKWMEQHEDAGALGVAMHNSYGTFAWESRRGIPTPLVSFCKMSGLSSIFPNHHIIGRYYMRFLDRTKPSQIEILSGAYMMLRRKALEQIGLLDESFFMYGEDIDLSYRMIKSGWNNYYLPHPIIHYKGESEHPSTVRYVNVFHEAMIIFYEKHFRNRYFLSGLLIRIAVYAKAFLTLIKHFTNKLFSPFRKTNREINFFCFTNNYNREIINQMVLSLGGRAIFVENAEELADAKEGDSMLFDTTVYSYDFIIQKVINQDESHKRLFVSTYDSKNGILMP